MKNPHEFNGDSDEDAAHITARDNLYENSSGTRAEGGGGTAFDEAPYETQHDDAVDVARRVKACAGPR